MRLLNNEALRAAATLILGLTVYLLLTLALEGEITAWRVANGLLIMGLVVWATHRQGRGAADIKRAGAALLIGGLALIAVVLIVASTTH